MNVVSGVPAAYSQEAFLEITPFKGPMTYIPSPIVPVDGQLLSTVGYINTSPQITDSPAGFCAITFVFLARSIGETRHIDNDSFLQLPLLLPHFHTSWRPLSSTRCSLETLRLETMRLTSTLPKMQSTDTLWYVGNALVTNDESSLMSCSPIVPTVQRQGQGRNQASIRSLGQDVRR